MMFILETLGGGFGCLLYPTLKCKPMYNMLLLGHGVCVRSGLFLTPADNYHHQRSQTRVLLLAL